MRTKDVVKRTGIDRETLRFYESKGLLPKASRNESGYRNYSEQTLARIEFISKAKKAGFTLSEIMMLIELQQRRGACRSGRDVVKEKRAEIKQKIKALRDIDKILQKFISECEKNGEVGLSQPCHFSFDKC